MISKRVTILLAVSALALTACGKENTAVDASIDFAKSESVAQNLQQAMADMTSAAAETRKRLIRRSRRKSQHYRKLRLLIRWMQMILWEPG